MLALQTLPVGINGLDYGLRWTFLDGAVESNWNYYKNNKQNVAGVLAAVADELSLLVPGVTPSGTDTQTVTPEGVEFETILNLSSNLRLLWNYSSNKMSNTDRYPAVKAAQLAKTDLLTDMVGEFPELQGIMGGYYARHDGLSHDIADAIEDHYRPRFAGDELPRNNVGLVVALATKPKFKRSRC